ncbi:hypothetical protein V492_03029 [Pseudogymnoascus sp. VKM F-4246]|nr:hypothetical protein V492_03029 [Pseudogymnoascus sp. VKM F-4246]
MTRFTRSTVVATTRTTRSKSVGSNSSSFARASSEPANPRAGRANATSTKATSLKRKREEEDSTEGVRIRRQCERQPNFEVMLPLSSAAPRESIGRPRYPPDSSDEERFVERQSRDNPGQDSEDESEDDSSDSSEEDGSEEESEEESEEDSSEEESEKGDSEKEDERQPESPTGGLPRRDKPTSRDRVVANKISKQEAETLFMTMSPAKDSPNNGKRDEGSHSEAQSEPQTFGENDHHLFEFLFEEEYERRNLAIQRALETVVPRHIAVGICKGTYALPLIGWRIPEKPPGADADGSDDIYCPPAAIRPGSETSLTTKELRETSSRYWDLKKYVSIHLTETGGDFNPPPDDPTLTPEENKKNLLIRRAQKWPLLTSGYESQESFEAAKEAQLIMDKAVADYITMYPKAGNELDEYLMKKQCELLVCPALVSLTDAVAELRQPNLVPSRSGPATSIAAPTPAQPITGTNSTSSSVARGQQRQSPCKKTPAKSCPQAPVLCSSSKAGEASGQSPKRLEKSAKASSAKKTPSKSASPPIVPSSSKVTIPSPVKTSQPKPVTTPSTKAPKNTSPVKTYLARPGSPSSTKGSAKTSPSKAPTAKSSLVPHGDAPVVAIKSQTQPGKTPLEIPSKESPTKSGRPEPVVSYSCSKFRVIDNVVVVTHKNSSITKGPGNPKSLSPVISSSGTAPAADRPKGKLGLNSSQKVPPNRCLPSSSESSSSSGGSSRSASPSPPQPNVRSAVKGKETRVIPRARATSVKRSQPSSPVKVDAEPRSRPEAANSPVAPPRTPSNRSEIVRDMKSRFEGLELSDRKMKHNTVSRPTPPTIPVTSDALEQLINPDNLFKRAEQLLEIAKLSVEEYGHPTRVIGSKGHLGTVDYIYSTIASLGDYYDISNQTFSAVTGNVFESRLVLGQDVPKSATPMGLTPPTKDRNPVYGQLRLVSSYGCDEDDFESHGKGPWIALVSRGICPFGTKSANAGKAGAIAAVIYNNENGGVSGTLGQPSKHHVATFGISDTDAAPYIEKLKGGHPVDSIAFIDATVDTIKTTNIIAQTRGGDSENCVMLGGHSDSVAEGPGINDDGSGSISLLEVATQLTRFSVANCVRFAWWAGEEEGLLGSDYYVSQLSAAESQRIRLFMDYDMMASPNFAFQIYNATDAVNPAGSTNLRELYEDYYDAHNLNHTLIPFDGRSDYDAFLRSGIPSGGIATGAEGIKTAAEAEMFGGSAGEWFDPCYHQLCDNLSNLDMVAWEVNTKLIAHSVATYARTLEDFPKRETLVASETSTVPATDVYHGHKLIILHRSSTPQNAHWTTPTRPYRTATAATGALAATVARALPGSPSRPSYPAKASTQLPGKQLPSYPANSYPAKAEN